jgi:DNA-directed RNA polymerase specialized sigma54-like protein
MFIGLQQKQVQTQTLIMTPQLQMTIKLLQLSRMELAERVKQELKENPALEDRSESGYENDTKDHDRIMDGIDRQIQLDSRSYPAGRRGKGDVVSLLFYFVVVYLTFRENIEVAHSWYQDSILHYQSPRNRRRRP